VKESYRLINDQVRRAAITHINSLECDGKLSVNIVASGNKSARQRGLQWRWYTDVSKAGVGGAHEDSKEGVHLICKYRFAVPIFIRDDEFFADLYAAYRQKYIDSSERIEWFIDTQVHTENFNVSQMAEYLTCIQQYYTTKGVALADPDRNLLAA